MTQGPTIASFSPKRALLAAVFVAALNLLVYYPTVFQETVNYDEILWIRAAQTPGWDGFLRLITYDKSVWGGLGYFAPLTAASMMMDQRIGSVLGREDMVYKASNLAVHVLDAVLALLLMRLLGFDLWVSVTVASIFSVHPLQVVSVAWLPERKNLLMSAFFLVSLAAYCKHRYRGGLRRYLASVGTFVMALMCKPSAVALGPCLLATDLFLVDRRLTMSSVWRITPFIVLGLFWTWVATSTEPAALDAPPLLERILMVPYKIGFLAAKYFVPVNLSLLYPQISVDSGSLQWWLQSFVFAGVCCLLWLIHRSVGLWGLLWGLCFYVLNLVPSLGVVPFSGMKELQVADHYQYLSNVGITLAVCLLVAGMVGRMDQPRQSAIKWALTVTAVAAMSLVSAGRLGIWNNAESLWTDVLAKHPKSYTARYNYAHYLDEKSRFKEAVDHYRLALEVNPASFQSYTNIGIILMKHGRMEPAAGYFNRAIEINPTFGEPHRNLAKIRFAQKRFQDALHHCRRAKELGTDCNPEELENVLQRGP
jgi:tetratricopeptide (TPR) repeat protein